MSVIHQDDVFDHYSPEFSQDPYATLTQYVPDRPVQWCSKHGGFWLVSDYNYILEICNDPYTFKKSEGANLPVDVISSTLIPGTKDAPDYVKYRKVFAPSFTAARMKQIRDEVRTISNRALDQFIERGACDIVTEYAYGIPAQVMMSILGFELSDWTKFADPLSFKQRYGFYLSPEQKAQRESANAKLYEEIRAKIDERRASPRNDLISTLLQAKVMDRPFTQTEIEGAVMHMFLTGFDTTNGAIANMILHLWRRPDIRTMVLAAPERLAQVIEEFLRFEPPSPTVARIVAKDTELGGVKILPKSSTALGVADTNTRPHAAAVEAALAKGGLRTAS
ncbi:MAG: cytochrome P450, partial [Hyphomicrobiaceae bacterium]